MACRPLCTGLADAPDSSRIQTTRPHRPVRLDRGPRRNRPAVADPTSAPPGSTHYLSSPTSSMVPTLPPLTCSSPARDIPVSNTASQARLPMPTSSFSAISTTALQSSYSELKHWSTRNDAPGPVEGLMNRHDGLYSHPSDQVAGYVEFVRRSHPAVDARTNVVGAAVFTGREPVDAYRQPPNRTLTTAFPCFSVGAHKDDAAQAKLFLSKNIKAPNAAFRARASRRASSARMRTRSSRPPAQSLPRRPAASSCSTISVSPWPVVWPCSRTPSPSTASNANSRSW